jgi:hypothetical protein
MRVFCIEVSSYFGITASIAAKVASFHFGITTVNVSPISALKWVTAAVRT